MLFGLRAFVSHYPGHVVELMEHDKKNSCSALLEGRKLFGFQVFIRPAHGTLEPGSLQVGLIGVELP